MAWMVGAGSLVLLILVILGLVDVARYREKMETWQTVVWVILIVFVPVIGLVAYLFWRLARSDAMQDSIDYTGERGTGKSRPLPPRGN